MHANIAFDGMPAHALIHLQDVDLMSRSRIFVDGVSLTGSWKRNNLQLSDIMSKFDNKEGMSFANLSFDEENGTSWFNLSIVDDIYLDSIRLNLSMNLKMSKFNRENSSFKIEYAKWNENSGNYTISENYNSIDPISNFDISFEMNILSISTEGPLDLEKYYLNDIRIDYSIKSNNLDIDIKASMHNAIITTSSSWRGIVINLGFFTLLIISWYSLSCSQEPIAINLGYEVIFIEIMFIYHCFFIFAHTIAVAKDHYFFMICLTVIAFFQCSIYQLKAMKRIEIEMRSLDVTGINWTRQEVYAMTWVIGSFVGVFLMAYYTSKIMVWRYHWAFMLAFFIYPAIQSIVTLVKANRRDDINTCDLLVNWCVPLAYLYFIRGSGNSYSSLKPHPVIMIYVLVVITLCCMIVLIYCICIGCILPVFLSQFIAIDTEPSVSIVISFNQPHYHPQPFDQTQYDQPRPRHRRSPSLDISKLLVAADRVPADKLRDNCSICFTTLKYDPNDDDVCQMSGIDGSNSSLQSLRSKVSHVMQLECKHYFHVTCLKQWLESKRSCPLCKNRVANL